MTLFLVATAALIGLALLLADRLKRQARAHIRSYHYQTVRNAVLTERGRARLVEIKEN